MTNNTLQDELSYTLPSAQPLPATQDSDHEAELIAYGRACVSAAYRDYDRLLEFAQKAIPCLEYFPTMQGQLCVAVKKVIDARDALPDAEHPAQRVEDDLSAAIAILHRLCTSTTRRADRDAMEAAHDLLEDIKARGGQGE